MPLKMNQTLNLFLFFDEELLTSILFHLNILHHNLPGSPIAQSAGAVEYTDCTSAEG